MKYNALFTVLASGALALSCSTEHYHSDAYEESYKLLIDSYIQEAADTHKIEKDDLFSDQPMLKLSPEWWTPNIHKKIFKNSVKESISPLSLYSGALKYSPQVKVFSELPLIRHTTIGEAQGRFDVHAFIEGKWEKSREIRSSNAQTTAAIFREKEYSLETGLKRQLETGGELSISQRFSQLDNNSISLSPNAQSKASFTVAYIQPLLKGAGLKYNNSIIKIAKIDHSIANDEFKRQIMAHLNQVNNSYWALYLARGQYLINQKLYRDTKVLVDKMHKRHGLDTVKSQLMRSEAALAERETSLIRSEVAIKNGESRLKILVNSPRLKQSSKIELLPNFHPVVAQKPETLQQALITALKNRPEIDQAFAQLKTLDIRKDMVKNELLPQLNLILETSFHGLAEEKDYGEALDNQWDQQRYLLGFSFDFPLQNRAAKARYMRRNLEYRQQISQITATIDTTLFDVKVSYRELITARREVNARHKSLTAANKDLNSILKRWSLAALKGENGGAVYMQFVLDSQGRKALAEGAYLNATVNYSIALENIERSKGTLLSFNKINNAPKTLDSQHLPIKKMRIEQ